MKEIMLKNRKRPAGFGLLLVAALWGFSFIAVKLSVDSVSPSQIAAIKFTISSLVLGLIYIKRLKNTKKETVLHGIVIGLALFFAELLQMYGCKYTTAGKNAFLTLVSAILVPFLNYFINREKIRAKSIVAALCAFCGVGLMSLDGMFLINLGDALSVLSGLFYALQIVLIARYAQDDEPIILAFLQFAICSIFSLIVSLLVDGLPVKAVLGTDTVMSLLYLALFSTMLGFLLQNLCQKYVSAASAAVILATESPFCAIFSYIFLGEVMTGRIIAGCTLVILAALITQISILPEFFPDERCDSTYNIDFDKLYVQGIRGIIFDIDNTLVMHDAPADDRARELLYRLNEIGFKVLFLSNNKEGRVKSFKDATIKEALYIYKAAKPKKSGYLKAVELMGCDVKSTVFIGDQIFTDVWGAKRCGIRNILVNPINPREEIQIVLKRRLEWFVLKAYEDTCRNEG